MSLVACSRSRHFADSGSKAAKLGFHWTKLLAAEFKSAVFKSVRWQYFLQIRQKIKTNKGPIL
jgi:hypothetical protein